MAVAKRRIGRIESMRRTTTRAAIAAADLVLGILLGGPVRAEEPPGAVHLLPGFDEYILGYRERSALPDDPALRRLILKNGMLSPTILISGRVAGTWRRTVRNGTVKIVTTPFSPLTGAEQDALAVAAQRYGEFLGMPVLVE